MTLNKVVSSPVMSSKAWEPLASHDTRKSVPSDLQDRGQSCNGLESHVSNLTIKSLSDPKLSAESSTKAEFYIGDESLVRTSSIDVKELLSRPVKNLNFKFANSADKNSKSIPPSAPEFTPEFTPPDGGYGWVIALSACVVNAFIVGLIKSYGVLYVSLMKRFPDATAYQASWLPVFLSTVGLIIAPITGILCRRFTSRKISFVGGLFAFAGVLLGAFAKSMAEMIFTFGLLTGIGAGLTTTPGVLITSLYFEKRRSLASAICVSGNAIGGFVFPPLIEYLLSSYGLTGTLLIIAALQLNICAASMLYRPITLHAMIQHKSRLKTKYILSEESKNLVTPLEDTFRTSSYKRPKDVELHHQVSFLRSASMLNSIPDLTQYARSWSTMEPGASFSHQPSCKAISICSKSSFVNTVSNVDLERKQSIKKGEPNCHALKRELSKRIREKPMSSLPELEFDSETSLPDLCNGRDAHHPQPNVHHPQPDAHHPQPEIQDQKYIDQNLNIDKTENLPKIESNLSRKIITAANIDISTSNCCCCRFFDCLLFKSAPFWLVSISVAFMAAGAPHALFFLPAYASSVNIDSTVVTYLLSISSVIDLIARLGTGFVADLGIIRSSLIYLLMELLAGISLLILPSMTSYTGMGIFLCLYGFGIGGWLVMIPTILAEHHGPKRLAASYGLVRMFQGIMNFVSPQVSGVIIDVTKNYSYTYYFMGSVMTLGAMLMLLEPVLVAKERRDAERQYTDCSE